MLSYADARALVIAQTRSTSRKPATLSKNVNDALGYVLAQEIRTDREYPPFHRSTRDGYAVRATEATQAPVSNASAKSRPETPSRNPGPRDLHPDHDRRGGSRRCGRSGDDRIHRRDGETVTFQRATTLDKISSRREAKRAPAIWRSRPGLRLGYAELAMAAQVGAAELLCYKRPRVAILSTGDEVVPITETPGPFHIRNSNSVSLAAQVRLAGGEPVLLGNALDRVDDLGAKIEQGLHEDMLVLSGGVSMGKYDLVETVLKSMGAEFFFDAVAIRPGKPAVFGRCRDTFVLACREIPFPPW